MGGLLRELILKIMLKSKSTGSSAEVHWSKHSISMEQKCGDVWDK
jgi:hypothetical protein